MYGLEKSINLGFMVGSELQQVCIGLYQTRLNFDKNLSISIESESHLMDENGSVMELVSDNPEISKQLVCLLGKKIEHVANLGKGQIKLILSGGYALILLDANENAESYAITSPDKEIIV